MANGCEPDEVLLRTLAPGAAFEMRGIRKRTHGVVVQHLSGSTIVDLGDSEPHWCSDAQVVSRPDIKDTAKWLNSNQKEKHEMAKKERTKKAVSKKDNTRRVIRFAMGKEDVPEKFLDEKNTAYNAVMYRAIKGADEPITFPDIWSAIYRSVSARTEGKTPKATLMRDLALLVEKGYIARTEAREEVEEEKGVAANA